MRSVPLGGPSPTTKPLAQRPPLPSCPSPLCQAPAAALPPQQQQLQPGFPLLTKCHTCPPWQLLQPRGSPRYLVRSSSFDTLLRSATSTSLTLLQPHRSGGSILLPCSSDAGAFTGARIHAS